LQKHTSNKCFMQCKKPSHVLLTYCLVKHYIPVMQSSGIFIKLYVPDVYWYSDEGHAEWKDTFPFKIQETNPYHLKCPTSSLINNGSSIFHVCLTLSWLDHIDEVTSPCPSLGGHLCCLLDVWCPSSVNQSNHSYNCSRGSYDTLAVRWRYRCY
jgi:hypothetical protein